MVLFRAQRVFAQNPENKRSSVAGRGQEPSLSPCYQGVTGSWPGVRRVTGRWSGVWNGGRRCGRDGRGWNRRRPCPRKAGWASRLRRIGDD